MGAVDEVTEAQIWLYDTLSNDPDVVAVYGNRISTHPAPRQFDFPRLTYFCLTPLDDTHVVGGEVFWARLRFLVRGIIRGSNGAELRPGVVAVQNALHAKRGETENAYIQQCIRRRPYSMHEMADSVEYYHLGAEYEINVSAKD